MKIPSLAVFSIVTLGFVLPVYAQDATITQSPTVIKTVTPNVTSTPYSLRAVTPTEKQLASDALNAYVNARKTANEARKLELGKKMLEEKTRIRTQATARLTTLLTSGNCRTLSSAYKTQIETELNAVISNLNSQKDKIKSLTTSEGVKPLFESVIQDNRVFVVIVPAVRGACASGRLIERLTTIIDGSLETLPSGSDSAKIKSDLEDALAFAKSAYANYVLALSNRKTNSTATVDQAKQELQAAIKKLKEVKESISSASENLVASPTATQ